jgi:hypothetical protein
LDTEPSYDYYKSGKMQFRYYERGGIGTFCSLVFRFQPIDLITDSLGHILISDNNDRVVHIISQDGDFIAHLLTQSDGISCPRGIAVDQSDNLWLVDREGVKVYQYLS